MYKLYEYKQDYVKIGVIVSDKEQCLYIGNTLYSAKTNKTPERKCLDSDITGRGLVKVELDPFRTIIAGEDAQPVYEHDEPDKSSILQHWYSRVSL